MGSDYQSKFKIKLKNQVDWSVARVKTSKKALKACQRWRSQNTIQQHVPKPFVIPVAPTLDVETLVLPLLQKISHSADRRCCS